MFVEGQIGSQLIRAVCLTCRGFDEVFERLLLRVEGKSDITVPRCIGMRAPPNVGYNINEKKLNSIPVNGLTFTDTDVKSGKTYYYVARTVNNAGKESIDSNETAATIP